MSQQSTSSLRPDALDPTSRVFESGKPTLQDLGRTHFIGIGGAGMSVLALMLKQAGLEVTGSDRQSSAKTRELEGLGIPVSIGQAAGNVTGARTVVWSSAIKPDNPEIMAARANGSVLAHRSDILALLLASHTGVTVAGAHGKTTTSALLAHILSTAGRGPLADPSYAVGGSIQSAQGPQDGGHLGSGQVLVAEADESDGSFEKYHPHIAVITNVEADHLDHYGSAEAFQAAFAEHARHAQGWVVVCGDDDGARSLLAHLRGDCPARVVVYTTADEDQIDEEGWDSWAHVARIEAERESAGSGAERFQLELPPGLGDRSDEDVDGRTLSVELAVPGIHNARNASAAIIAAILLGMNPTDACTAASSFQGASRRFEVKGQERGVTVVDDYAHHPTEIAALLAAARRRYPRSRIHVLFQPHLYSRTRFFASQFAQALAAADDVVVTGIYPARERQEDFPDVGPETIVRNWQRLEGSSKADSAGQGRGCRMETVENLREGAERLADRARKGDVIITVGAGDVTRMGAVILNRLADEPERGGKSPT
ncbi:UDP-N-acetylmuramate--L-alanine ligase [Bifidobacterium actinocoloniiforme DSM 22766]|uniref:UDP-N-acetylmuramate--L-alanine ligase n=1 Tax=Bifidobacterium actinocoloniiforme DSM 22766 TaxID=1437605 RepID=A0A086YZS3_9BIFI|nr:UDP-N-acetylmuramate--L-alanine ligase [Bifidobacterium actinocoloniiforme]AKV55068.1 UDP-N-acetylmuramate--alanine ligase [Bifidobacterium actinocoloniiforme DSM 22766]KFI39773.1 UDP-N-acetylmuramate--L-alanine ligase [Bifidobacterium actinocoloniiforme DSM 22766]